MMVFFAMLENFLFKFILVENMSCVEIKIFFWVYKLFFSVLFLFVWDSNKKKIFNFYIE